VKVTGQLFLSALLDRRLSDCQRWSGRSSDGTVSTTAAKLLGERHLKDQEGDVTVTKVDVKNGLYCRGGKEIAQFCVQCCLNVSCVEPWVCIARDFPV
jgi:hypothetical protein